MSASSRSKVINLLCPSLSKFVPFVAYEDHGVDVGTIARTFGVDPFTLRLNGHLIGRGVDLVSSLTWKSLLSFFAKKGVSTGKSHRDALIVDGKFCHHLQSRAGPVFDYGNEDNQVAKDNGLGTKRKPRSDSEDINSLKKRKMYECNLGPHKHFDTHERSEGHSFITKRKMQLDDVNLLKKRRMNQCIL